MLQFHSLGLQVSSMSGACSLMVTDQSLLQKSQAVLTGL